MKPVYQREQHDPARGVWGDCHRSALASLLELPLSDVPHFAKGGRADWRERERAWLAGMGLEPALAEIPAADQGEALRLAARINPDRLGRCRARYEAGNLRPLPCRPPARGPHAAGL